MQESAFHLPSLQNGNPQLSNMHSAIFASLLLNRIGCSYCIHEIFYAGIILQRQKKTLSPLIQSHSSSIFPTDSFTILNLQKRFCTTQNSPISRSRGSKLASGSVGGKAIRRERGRFVGLEQSKDYHNMLWVGE